MGRVEGPQWFLCCRVLEGFVERQLIQHSKCRGRSEGFTCGVGSCRVWDMEGFCRSGDGRVGALI